MVWETFNAGNAKLTVKGVTAHPMSSKGVLVNPILVGHDFINMLDRAETPECTENREGFVVLKTMQANPSQAVLTMKVRDHNKALYERKKETLVRAAEYLRFRHPKAGIEIELSDSYANIADAVRDDNRVGIDYLYDALSTAGVEPKTTAMRGGTDGSYLSVKGILTPNYFTGAHNFHSNCEFLPEGLPPSPTRAADGGHASQRPPVRRHASCAHHRHALQGARRVPLRAPQARARSRDGPATRRNGACGPRLPEQDPLEVA